MYKFDGEQKTMKPIPTMLIKKKNSLLKELP